MMPQIGDTVETFAGGRATIIDVDKRGRFKTETGLRWVWDGQFLQSDESVAAMPVPISVANGLSIFHPKGEVFEIRMFGVPKGRNGYKVTKSGYFDDPVKAAKAIKPYEGRITIYHTLNPINPDLLARAHNRLVERPKSTTADHDVIRRRWLQIDTDPVRPSGISATDAEVETAVALRDGIAKWLAGWGWEPAIKAMSGNGGHLLYRIDLPNDDQSTELIKGFLSKLAIRFDNEAAKVDTSVFNASRIWKVYGTTACKGDNLPERPHRKAEITYHHSGAAIVTMEMITAVTSDERKSLTPFSVDPKNKNGPVQGACTQATIENALHQIGVDFSCKTDSNGRLIFRLQKCLTSNAHTDGAAITLGSEGKTGYVCHHNSCQNMTWQDVKSILGFETESNGHRGSYNANGSKAETAVVKQSTNATNGEPGFSTFADIARLTGEIEWAWPGWMAKGYLHLLASESGIGKSFLAMRIAGCFLKGLSWPNGVPYSDEIGFVLWCEAEAAQQLNKERAKALSLPLENIIIPNTDPFHDIDLRSNQDKDSVWAWAYDERVKFIIVDSLSGADPREENDSAKLSVLKWWAELARNTGKPILITHHLNKPLMGNEKVTLHRLRGSTSIPQLARVIWAMDTPDPHNKELKRLSVLKNNLAAFPEPIGVTIGNNVQFGGAPSAPEQYSELDRAIDFLRDLLTSTPVAAKEVKAAAQAEDLSMGTVNRAKKKMGVISLKRENNWVWSLPGEY